MSNRIMKKYALPFMHVYKTHFDDNSHGPPQDSNKIKYPIKSKYNNRIPLN